MLLNNIIDSKNKMKIIRELSLHENWDYSINELSKITGIHRVRISSAMNPLYNLGVIKIKEKGKVKLISINKENYFVRNIIIDLFEKEKNLAINIANEISKNIKEKNIIAIILFGSAVKDEFKLKSDIDLMIIYNKKIDKKNIENIIEEYNKKGLLISYDIIDIKEFRKLFKGKGASIMSMVKYHKILYGKNILEMV